MKRSYDAGFFIKVTKKEPVSALFFLRGLFSLMEHAPEIYISAISEGVLK